jgi:Icc-related predicted phosphoesterase
MKIVAISDTHNLCEAVPVPDGDVLVHAGDLTMQGSGPEIAQAARWLGSFKPRFKAIIAIAGNHDFGAQHRPGSTRATLERHGITYLVDEPAVVGGVKFYGSPWQPWFYDWAFNFPQDDGGVVARRTWAKIPHDTHVLVTHGPPHGVLDQTFPGDDRVGCPHLLAAIRERPSIRAHVFGHIHEAHGTVLYEAGGGTTLRFVNAAICDRPRYAPIQPPIVFDIRRA